MSDSLEDVPWEDFVDLPETPAPEDEASASTGLPTSKNWDSALKQTKNSRAVRHPTAPDEVSSAPEQSAPVPLVPVPAVTSRNVHKLPPKPPKVEHQVQQTSEKKDGQKSLKAKAGPADAPASSQVPSSRNWDDLLKQARKPGASFKNPHSGVQKRPGAQKRGQNPPSEQQNS